MSKHFANTLQWLDSQFGPVSAFISSVFVLLVEVFDGCLTHQAGVCLPSSAGLGTTGFMWLPLACATSLTAAWFGFLLQPSSLRVF